MYIVLVRLVSASPFLPSYSAFFVSFVLLLLLHFLVPLPPVFLVFVFFFRFLKEVLKEFFVFGFIERIKKEYSPSQIEIILRYTDAMKAADDLVTLRSVAKNIAQSYDLLATFLPKPFNDAGNSGLHSHISVYDNNLFMLGIYPLNYGFIIP